MPDLTSKTDRQLAKNLCHLVGNGYSHTIICRGFDSGKRRTFFFSLLAIMAISALIIRVAPFSTIVHMGL